MSMFSRQRSMLSNESGAIRLRLVAIVLVVIVVAWWIVSPRGIRRNMVDKASTSAVAVNGAGGNRAQSVSVAAVRRQDIREMVSAIGTITAANTSIVRAKVDGDLLSVHFKEGQLVRAGQLLAQIDPRPFQIALAQAEGVLARDQAQLRNAKLDFERFRDLLSKDAIAKQQVDTQDALVHQLQGTVQSDQAQVDNARLQLSYTSIKAPISGLTGLTHIDLGNFVHTNDVNGLLTITQMQPVNVMFTVPDIYLPKIRRQLKAGVVLHVEAWDRDQKTLLADGRVATTDNAIDTATGTIKLKAEFANADGSLFSNQFVNVRMHLDTLNGSLAVPASALMRSERGSFVYLVNDDSSVTIRGVLAGESDGSWVGVRGDLKPNDRVVTDGADRLRNGAKVDVIARGAAVNGVPPAATIADQGLAGTQPSVNPKTAADSTSHSASTPQSVAAAAAPGRAASSAAPNPVKVSTTRSAAGGERPAWVDRLPPDVAEKVMKMKPEDRQAWADKRLEERARQAAAPTADGARPAWMDRLPPEVAEKLMKLSPEERQAWVKKRLEERARQSGGAAPAN